MNELSDINDIEIDILTNNPIEKNSLKYIWLYVPIIWFSGTLVIIQFTAFWRDYAWIPPLFYLLLPWVIFIDFFIFIFTSLFITKLILIFVELLHKPREGVFNIKEEKREYNFWCIRRVLKKYIIWIMRNSPMPYIDIIGFKLIGIKADFSSSILDCWIDLEFVETGKRVFLGQGSSILSSMVIGNYLIIKKVILEDNVVLGGVAQISPGTIVRENTIIGAGTMTSFNQELDPNWVYIGRPAKKFKPNKYAESNRDIRIMKDVAKGIKFTEKI
ncbi:hypothetical protein ES703_63823 [subsurface metagenome]